MPYAPGTIPTFVKFGPGWLYAAAEGATEPTDLTTAWAAAWKKVGYTDNGSTFTSTPTFEGVQVAEVLLDIAKQQTGLDEQIEFALAEFHAQNLQRVYNGGMITSSGTGATAIDKFEPPAFGTTLTRIAIGWEANDASERWVFRRCLQTGAVAVARQRGAAKATLPATFSLEPPVNGAIPWMSISKSTATIT